MGTTSCDDPYMAPSIVYADADGNAIIVDAYSAYIYFVSSGKVLHRYTCPDEMHNLICYVASANRMVFYGMNAVGSRRVCDLTFTAAFGAAAPEIDVKTCSISEAVLSATVRKGFYDGEKLL